MDNKNLEGISSQQKWKMFKNYLHNEIGVTKDDIRAWIKEACNDVAEKLIKQELGEFDPERIVKKVVDDTIKEHSYYSSSGLKKEITDKVARRLTDRFMMVDRIDFFKNNGGA